MRQPRPILPLITDKAKARFAAKLAQNGECIEFTGFLNLGGYGVVCLSGVRALAHRLAWVIETGREPADGMILCHRCNNTKCCNIKHLYEGTAKTNADDRRDADVGRTSRPLLGITGPNHPRGYDQDRRRRAILMRANAIPFKDIADMLGCHRQTVERWWAQHVRAMEIASKLRGE